MDFFHHQERERFGSLTLLALFAVVVIALFFVVAVCVSLITNLFSVNPDFLSLSTTGLIVAGLFWLVIGLGCFFRWLDVIGGGARLARRFGAQPVELNTKDADEQRLLRVTAEMAIAAGVQNPDVWIMPYEKPINAFVLGSQDDVAIVLTQSAMRELTREELQAVVAHELGHVVQGDLAINMRLLIVLSGLMALNEVGDTLGENIAASVFRGLGAICVLSGSLIRAAFSRRREYLADAMAVQFTRNSQAVTSALHAIDQHHDARNLECRFRQELAHLCFQVPAGHSWWHKRLATHPAIKERISRIDPHFQAKLRNRMQQKKMRDGAVGRSSVGSPAITQTTALNALSESESTPGSGRSQSGKGIAMIAAVVSTTAAASTKPQSEKALNKGLIGERICLLLPDVSDCLAAMFALFVSNEERSQKAFFNSLAFAYEKPFAQQVKTMYTNLGQELRKTPLVSINHIGEVLTQKMDLEQRRHLLKNLENLLIIENEMTILHYACLTLLRKRLGAEHPLLDQVWKTSSSPVKILKMNLLANDVSLLLSLLLQASGNTDARNRAEFERVMKTYTNKVLPFRDEREKGVVKAMQGAFQALALQPRVVRNGFIEHCAEVVVADYEVTEQEQWLLQLFAESLNADPPGFQETDGGYNHRIARTG